MSVGGHLSLLLSLLTLAAGEYCEDFEEGMGQFWQDNRFDTMASWQAVSYENVSKLVPDFPPETSGQRLAYVLPKFPQERYVSARLITIEEHLYPAGSWMQFKYWIRSQYQGGNTLNVRLVVGGAEQPTPFLDLSPQGTSDNTRWNQVNVSIPEVDQKVQIQIFAGRGVSHLDQVAIDDVIINGPLELNHPCVPLTTVPPPVTTTAPSTTPPTTTAPSTTPAEPTTVTAPLSSPTTAPSTATTAPDADTTTSAPSTPDPHRRCLCSLGIHEGLISVHTLVTFPPFLSFGCDSGSEKLCHEQCKTHTDVLQAQGSWSVPMGDHSVGDLACQSLGRDETRGIATGVYSEVCERNRRKVDEFHPRLCCDDGRYKRCEF